MPEKKKSALFVLVILTVVLLLGMIMITSREPTRKEPDETSATRMSLLWMGSEIGHYFQISDETDREAIRRVHTLEELWGVIHKKQGLVPFPVEKNYLFDAGGRPFVLVIIGHNKETTIRISSRGDEKKDFVEIVFDGSKLRQKCSWIAGD